MTDMIERVAQAIFAKDPESLFTIHQARVYARAAIEAMRSPTSDMIVAKVKAQQQPTGFAAIVEWKAMIAAALEDE
jgi:hypothetical protein